MEPSFAVRAVRDLPSQSARASVLQRRGAEPGQGQEQFTTNVFAQELILDPPSRWGATTCSRQTVSIERQQVFLSGNPRQRPPQHSPVVYITYSESLQAAALRLACVATLLMRKMFPERFWRRDMGAMLQQLGSDIRAFRLSLPRARV